MGKTGIVAFAFGSPETIRSNQRIAHIASQNAIKLGAPVYTQLDIYIHLEIRTEYIAEEVGNPPPTLRIAKGAVRWAKQRGITELLVIAAKPHLWRCVRDLIRSARETQTQIMIRVCEEIEQYPKNSWFCPESTQTRTQSEKNWQKREWFLKLLPFFIYKRIAN